MPDVNYVSLLRDLSGKEKWERGVVFIAGSMAHKCVLWCVFWLKQFLVWGPLTSVSLCSSLFLLRCSISNVSLLFVYRRAWAASSDVSACHSSSCLTKGSFVPLCRTTVNGGRRHRPRGQKQFCQGHVAQTRPPDHSGPTVYFNWVHRV